MDARAWDDRYAATDLVWSADPNVFVAAECAALAPGRALDLAAGEGRNALWLASRGWEVTAVDFSAIALEKAQRLAEGATVGAPLPITWVCADVLTWEVPAPVDLVVIAYLQVPAAQRRTVVRRAFGSLAPGGTLLLVAHDSSNLTEGVGGPRDPDVLMTASDVVADLAGERFTVVRAERVARTVTPAEPHRGTPHATAYDCLVRVTRD